MKLLGRSGSLQSVVSNLDLVLFEAQNRCQCIGQRLLVIYYQNPCHVALQIGEDPASPTQGSICDCRAAHNRSMRHHLQCEVIFTHVSGISLASSYSLRLLSSRGGYLPVEL